MVEDKSTEDDVVTEDVGKIYFDEVGARILDVAVAMGKDEIAVFWPTKSICVVDGKSEVICFEDEGFVPKPDDDEICLQLLESGIVPTAKSKA